jgi:hypothetical protein
MTVDTSPCAPFPPCDPADVPRGPDVPTRDDRLPDISQVDGWQALAVASLGRLLTGPELTAVERLPAAIGLDLLFPDLGDAARHEALSTLDDW